MEILAFELVLLVLFAAVSLHLYSIIMFLVYNPSFIAPFRFFTDFT